jgi:serine/threonine protein kinase
LIGRTLSHFEITAKLGEGGMGEVYRATDSTLGREVAIKVLPEAFTADPERLARFEREARVLASLNHTNIAAIHEVGEQEGTHFLIMELAAGDTLAERIERGPIPLDEAIQIALQIAEGLEAAHEQGIIHRDLKPANVKVSPEGQIKLLDFGLAKALDPLEAGDSPNALSMSPTLTAQMAGGGALLGTAAYMSPEQARGHAVDKRADIWAFGVILFEILSGHRGFAGDTLQDTLASVLTAEVDLGLLPSETPPVIRRLIERCLEKDPSLRLRDIGEARILLQRPLEAPPEAQAEGKTSASPDRFVMALVGIAAAALAGLLGWILRPDPPSVPLRKLRLDVGFLDTVFQVQPKISPDGTRIVYRSGNRLWIRDLAELGSREVPASLGGVYPCWSPDSRQIAFGARGRLWKVDVSGGSLIPLATFPREVLGSGGMVWLPDRRIVLAGGPAGLEAVSDQGGSLETLLPLDPDKETDFHELGLLPDGRGILFVAHRKDPEGDRRLVDTISLFSEGQRKDVLFLEGDGLQSVTYSPTGHLLFHRRAENPGLWAVRFDLDTLQVRGEPFMVAPDSRLPSIAADGTLLMVHGLSMPARELVRVDRQGLIQWAAGHRQSAIESPVVSPNGKRVALMAREGNNWDIWIYDVELSTKTRLTFAATYERPGDWSSVGDRILYEIVDMDVLALIASGGGESEVVTDGIGPDWSADERVLFYSRFNQGNYSYDIFRLTLGETDPEPLLTSPANEFFPQLSPDGSLLAYSSDESGREEVYVRGVSEGSSKWQVSSTGGEWARWSADGSELFFVADGELTAVPVLDRSPLTLGSPKGLFSLQDLGVALGPGVFAVSPDSQSFFLAREVDDPASRSALVLVQNWLAEFESDS